MQSVLIPNSALSIPFEFVDHNSDLVNVSVGSSRKSDLCMSNDSRSVGSPSEKNANMIYNSNAMPFEPENNWLSGINDEYLSITASHNRFSHSADATVFHGNTFSVNDYPRSPLPYEFDAEEFDTDSDSETDSDVESDSEAQYIIIHADSPFYRSPSSPVQPSSAGSARDYTDSSLSTSSSIGESKTYAAEHALRETAVLCRNYTDIDHSWLTELDIELVDDPTEAFSRELWNTLDGSSPCHWVKTPRDVPVDLSEESEEEDDVGAFLDRAWDCFLQGQGLDSVPLWSEVRGSIVGKHELEIH